MTTQLSLDHPHFELSADEASADDSLKPANGILYGLLFSLPIWLLILSVIHSFSS